MRSSSAPANISLNKAKVKKDNEFYTDMKDVRDEIMASGCYEGCFFDKTVLCNCNDLGKSGFRQFFVRYFSALGLKSLITVSYGENAKAAVFNGARTEYYPLAGDGDFRSDECVKMLQAADVVATNPPFELFREFLLMMVEYDKDFLIVGDVINGMPCKKIFPLYMEGKVRFGCNLVKSFTTPEGTSKFGKVGWYTNIGTPLPPEPLKLTKKYTGHEDEYPRYDNYLAISVDRVKDIPADYFGKMGIPSSYLLVHDPCQFEIIGTSGTLAGSVTDKNGKYIERPARFYVGGSRLQERIVISRTGFIRLW